LSDSGTTPRIFTRSETAQFRVSFYADLNQTTPLVPISPSYPTYTVLDPSGTPIQTGVGTLISAGNYKAEFLIPKDAPLSYFHQAPQRYGNEGQGTPLTANDARYQIEWQIVTDANQQVTFVEEFDVRDVAVTQSLNRELKFLAIMGRPIRLTYREAFIPYKAECTLMVKGNDVSPAFCVGYDSVLANAMPPIPQDLQVVRDGDSYVLYADVPPGKLHANTAYIALWTIQETEFSVPETQWNIITVIAPSLLPMITSLRMLLDKFQKRLGRAQAFEDSDLLEYLANGLRMVNTSYPTTGFTMQNLPDVLQSLVFLAAGWWGLKAQGILETDLAFNFSGQSVTLSVDRASALDSAASAMMEMFNSQIAPAKMALIRAQQGMGTVATRGYSWRPQGMVFRTSSTTLGSMDFLGVISKLGLL